MLPHLHFIQKGRKDGTEEEGIFVADGRAETEGTPRGPRGPKNLMISILQGFKPPAGTK